MNRLATEFEQRRASGRRSLLPFIPAGYPDLATTIDILTGIDAEPCACVELGIPFSDPIADGPVIQTSFARALAGGFRVGALFDALAARRGSIAVPLVAMVSYSIVFRLGPAQFLAAARRAGIDGLIVPDLALEEADGLAHTATASGCCLVMMVAPTTEPARRARIAALSTPFLYYQSLAGVTGERRELPAGLASSVAELRDLCAKPVCVGFGVSTAAQVSSVCAVADGAIVGSALVRRMNDAVDRGEARGGVVACVLEGARELATGVAR